MKKQSPARPIRYVAVWLLLLAAYRSWGQIPAVPWKAGITDLECENLTRPLGVDTEAPMLSWKLADHRTGASQTAYRVEVASRASLLTAGTSDVWDSGRVASQKSIDILYAGPKLKSETRYYWRVQVWDAQGKPYPPSSISWWETGVHGDWTASHWIGYEDLEHRSIRAARPGWITNSAPPNYKGAGPSHHNFRLEFTLSSAAVRATLYATGEDSTGAWLNGQRALSTVPQPKWGRTPWHTYSEADVKASLRQGKNLLAIDILQYEGRGHSQTPMSAELYLEMADGSTQIITTDSPGWKATLNADGQWFDSAYNDSAWLPAVPFAAQADASGSIQAVGNPLPTDPVVAFRHTFTTAKSLRSARLYATALGAYKFYINGQTVGDQVLSPGWTDFREHVMYQAYDVTSLVADGANAIGALLAPGWYSTPLEWVGQGNNYGSTPPALRAQLRLEYTDGSVELIGTDSAWKADDSPIQKAEIYDGETYNANLVQPGWDTVHFSAPWTSAALIEPTPVKIEWQSFQPIRVTRSLAAVSVTRTKDGRYIYDFGQEVAGVAKITVQGNKGTNVKLRFAEVLNPDGTLYVDNLRNAKATDHYILSGNGREVYQPLFTFHGFRYVELSGPSSAPLLSDVKAIVLHTDAADTVTLTTGSKMVNKLWSNILWGQRSNFVGVPTDCPQRDERLGWAADAQVFWRAASYNMDLTAFSRKYAEDLRGTQVGTAMYGIYAPGTTKPNVGFDSGWSDAGVIVPWTSWIQTGDEEILTENWDAMQRYVDAIEASNPDHLWKEKSGTAHGDWLSPEGRTSQVLISTAYWAYDVSLMKEMAHALGKSQDEAKYNQLFTAIKIAFDHEFLSQDGYVGILDKNYSASKQKTGDTLPETQTGYVLALHMNLLPPEAQPMAARRLVALLQKNGWRLGTGFLGTPYLLEALTGNGYSDVAYKLLLNETYPSWGYMVDHGATTMWERWNGDAMRADPGMNSYNHYAYGAVADWIYRYAAGIDATAGDPGFHEIVLHPQFNESLGSLSLNYVSRYGLIRSSWKIKDNIALWSVTIPANTTAQLSLTTDEEQRFKLQGKSLTQSGPMLVRHVTPRGVTYILPSGTFSFTASLAPSTTAGFVK